jgi:hypothetical protein
LRIAKTNTKHKAVAEVLSLSCKLKKMVGAPG